MRISLLLLLATLTLSATSAFAGSCAIRQTSDGDFGVAEYRASGWVYLVRGLTYEQAEAALERMSGLGGRCGDM